jgi:hypothetical protein
MAESDAVKPMEAQGIIDSVNLKYGYITVYDIPLGVDKVTRVYDQKGGLLSKKSLKLGQMIQFVARLPNPNSKGNSGANITLLKTITIIK